MTPADRVRLRHICDAVAMAQRFVSGRERGDLDRDPMLLFALVHAVQIVGEAAGRVSEDARAELEQVPWPKVIGMRNRLVHAYFDIDKNILWTTVHEALPPVDAAIRRCLGKDE